MLFLTPFIFALVAADLQNDPASYQLASFKNKTKEPIGTMTTAAGAPVEYTEATTTLNTNILCNEHFFDDLTSLVRERIPERVVHAPGSGAFGYFETTHDISHICKAKMFSKVGKRTPIAVRFSIGFSSVGARDTVRETRGFALKCYTEEGNLDLIGLNSPVFAFKDPLLFSTLTHVLKRNPSTNLPDPNMLVDYITKHPESIFDFMHILSDFGMPAGYHHMPAYPIHTYQVYNHEGVSSYLKFHILPVLGVKNFNITEAAQIAAGDPDYYSRSLHNLIATCQYPKWYLSAQIVSEEQRKKAHIDIFDVTIKLPLDQYPLQQIGILTLNKNPVNYFAEIEQLALCPGNLVPGILGAPDVVFQSRRVVYRDAQNYRLGSNFKKIPVNCPMQNKALTYIRDGVPPLSDNGKDAPNYYPNSYNGPIPYKDQNRPELVKIFEKPPNNFKQAGEYFSNELNSVQRNALITNFVELFCSSEQKLKNLAIKWLTMIHKDFGKGVAKGLAKNCAK